MPSALARAHILAGERLRRIAAQAVGAAWQGLAAYNEENVPEFLAAAVPVVVAAQRQSVSLTEAYLARSIGRRPVGVNPLDVISQLRGDTTPEDVYRRPFVTVWTSLKERGVYEQAVAAGLAHAVSSARMDVQMAMRQTMQTVQDAEPRIRGYVRVPDGGACDYCLALAGAFVKNADAMPLHNGCGCGLEPVVDDRPPVTPVPDSVAVHEHGELGPVLGDPGHDFTSV